MNLTDDKYTKFALCREMMDTVDVVRNFDAAHSADMGKFIGIAEKIKSAGKLMLTGEGSSRIFPAKNMIRKCMQRGVDLQIVTEGSRQAMTYDLSKFAVFAASNSGRTKEVVKLLQNLKEAGNENLFGLSAKEDNLLKDYAETLVLKCGWENAVAATKSVVEQALVYQFLICTISGTCKCEEGKMARFADAVEAALTMEIPTDIVEAACGAGTIYFAGYNDGVAEELTLKTNEITRKKSDFLEGTYACHGIEEVMDPNDIVFVIDPIREEIPKFKEVLVDGVGMKVVAIANEQTDLPTLIVPEAPETDPFVYLAAGWNLLVEIGLKLGIDLDKPERARKVGNEFEG